MQNQDTVAFRTSKQSDLELIHQFLQKLDLPITGVDEQFENFFLLFDSSALIGCAGIEFYGSYGLIRSVAIEPSYQGKNLGSRIVGNVELLANDKKVSSLYLLTETAEKFFKKLGYEVVARKNVPQEIQDSLEYSSACKETAIVMKKELG